GGDAGVGLHASADEGDLTHLVVVEHVGPVALLLHLLEQFHGAWPVGPGAGEGDVGGAVLHGGDVLQHHVYVDLGVGKRTEDLGGLTRLVGDTQNGDLGLGLVGGYT